MKLFLVFMTSLSLVDAAGESAVIGSHEPVKVVVGEDVILPCHLEPPFDMTTLTVEWKYHEGIVHLYRHRTDYLADQEKNFKGRTSLFRDEMSRGNISLKLTNVTEQDEGNYTCFVPKLGSQLREGYVMLIVEKKPERDEGSLTNDSSTDTGTAGISNITVAAVVFVATVVVVVVVSVLLKKKKKTERNEGSLTDGDAADSSSSPTEDVRQGKKERRRNKQRRRPSGRFSYGRK
ncbi:butyrophilin-like protein 2 isoform X2 [Micropterus salmoides]|uniref:butyrophilin-like protein 2 isoform X2 n=1 Tax=Micropterus salmoides TaxID=27706 RepID=UPI0018EC4594|nr:butyrophilin-like protein 2 isoform X2 [Micropterus salmoides]